MHIAPLRTEADHRLALAEIERLMAVPEDALPAAEGDRLEVLAVLVEEYERRHHPIPPADPIEAIAFMMEQKGWTRADLEPLIGGRGRVSEVLTRKRALSLGMIRALSEALRIPAEVLLAPYDLRPDPPPRRKQGATPRAAGSARSRAA
jgi:HTH-type transcriptional regulator/antitoxin HigA